MCFHVSQNFQHQVERQKLFSFTPNKFRSHHLRFPSDSSDVSKETEGKRAGRGSCEQKTTWKEKVEKDERKLERAFHNNKPRKENSELDKVFKRFRTVWGAFTNELPKSFQKRGMKKFSICANFLLLNFLARRMFSCRRPAIISSTRLQAVYFYFHSIHFCLPSQPRREKSFTWVNGMSIAKFFLSPPLPHENAFLCRLGCSLMQNYSTQSHGQVKQPNLRHECFINKTLLIKICCYQHFRA